MLKISELEKLILSKLASLPALPGQGVFGSEPSEDFDFTISMYESDMPKSNSKNDVNDAVDEFVSEYVHCIETHYTTILEKVKKPHDRFDESNVAGMHCVFKGQSDIVTCESLGEFVKTHPKFKAAKKTFTFGNIKLIGTIGKCKIYVNNYVKNTDMYVIERSLIDVKYQMQSTGKRINMLVKLKKNCKCIVKYTITLKQYTYEV